MYTTIGMFGYLRKELRKEFKRVGISKVKDKYGYCIQVLGKAPYLNEMSLSEMETVIRALRVLPNEHFGHLIEEKKEKSAFAQHVTQKRDQLGWQGNMFQAMTGISKYRLARIATGTIEPTKMEKEIIQKAFERGDMI